MPALSEPVLLPIVIAPEARIDLVATQIRAFIDQWVPAFFEG
jgi:hypothetical protein